MYVCMYVEREHIQTMFITDRYTLDLNLFIESH